MYMLSYLFVFRDDHIANIFKYFIEVTVLKKISVFFIPVIQLFFSILINNVDILKFIYLKLWYWVRVLRDF